MATVSPPRRGRTTLIPATNYRVDEGELPTHRLDRPLPDLNPRPTISDRDREFLETRKTQRDELCAFLILTPGIIGKIEELVGNTGMRSIEVNLTCKLQELYRASSREIYFGSGSLMLHHSGIELLSEADLGKFLRGEWHFAAVAKDNQPQLERLLSAVGTNRRPSEANDLFYLYQPSLAVKITEAQQAAKEAAIAASAASN